MVRLHQIPIIGLAASPALGALVQKPGLVVPPSAGPNRDAVKKIFTDSYAAYKKYAYGHDDVSPLSQSYSDGRNGWGASIVDAMSTMHIMGLDDLFVDAVNFTSKIDFSKSQTSDTVSVFETTIRYLGGFLSAYELSDYQYPILLQKAKEVADKMAYAWVGKNDVPYGFLTFASNKPTISSSNIAEAGTLSLEWETLTKYTKNQTYADLAIKSLRHIASLPGPLPGLAAQGIDPTSGKFVGSYVTWGGGSDSYFEYLIKHARLSNTNDNIFADTWATAVDSSIKTLLRTSTVGNHTYLADYDGKSVRFVGSHLACFYGGNWIMGGKLLNNQTIVDIALKLVDGCWNTYASTASGIGPEAFAFIAPDGNYTGPGNTISASQLSFYNQHGFYITSSPYILRPEVLESNFYAWRATGDTKYLDRAASAVAAFNKQLQTPSGYAGLDDVNTNLGDKIDDTESFWFAEVLKYLYLTFDDPSHISLDDYVFNTEAHPFRAPSPKRTYGTHTFFPPKPFTSTTGPSLPAISPSRFLPPKTNPPAQA